MSTLPDTTKAPPAIELRKVSIAVVRVVCHQHGEPDTEALAAGIPAAGDVMTEREWAVLEDELHQDAEGGVSPYQRFMVEAELPFRRSFKDMDVIRRVKVILVPKLIEQA